MMKQGRTAKKGEIGRIIIGRRERRGQAKGKKGFEREELRRERELKDILWGGRELKDTYTVGRKERKVHKDRALEDGER